jgi:hypothetical protein
VSTEEPRHHAVGRVAGLVSAMCLRWLPIQALRQSAPIGSVLVTVTVAVGRGGLGLRLLADEHLGGEKHARD